MVKIVLEILFHGYLVSLFMAQSEEIFKQNELFVGSIGVILSLFFGLFLLITRKQTPKANIFLAIYLLAFSLRIG